MKRKNPVLIEQREIQIGSMTYTYRKWADGSEQFYRYNRRQACLVKLDVDRNFRIVEILRVAMV